MLIYFQKNSVIDVILVGTVTDGAKQQRNDLNTHLTDHRSLPTDPGWSAGTVDHPSQNQLSYILHAAINLGIQCGTHNGVKPSSAKQYKCVDQPQCHQGFHSKYAQAFVK